MMLILQSFAEGASVPALGLSNKAVYESDLSDLASKSADTNAKIQYPEVYFKPQALTREYLTGPSVDQCLCTSPLLYLNDVNM